MMMICLEFRGDETISDGGNASSVTRGGESEGLCCPGPGRADREGGTREGARKWHDGQKNERVFQFALCHQYDCLSPTALPSFLLACLPACRPVTV